jgi:hypothetical protein
MGLDDQSEPVWDEQRGYDVESGAGVRNAANDAVNCAVADTDGASFENAAARYNSTFWHRYPSGWWPATLQSAAYTVLTAAQP